MRKWKTEKMGFDDGSAQVRNIRDPEQPTVKEHQEHMTTHRPYRSWCKFCVMGRGRSDTQEDLEGVPHVSMDYGFLGERESEEEVSPVLVVRERRHKMTWAMLVPRRGTEFPLIAKRAARFTDQLGHNTVALRCVTTSQRLKRWQLKSDKLAKKVVRLFRETASVRKVSPKGSSNVLWGRSRVRIPVEWTQSRIRHHNLVSHTGDRRRQVCDPAPSLPPTRAPARVTWPSRERGTQR